MTYTKAITLLDGAMGTMLQRAGLKLGDRPETLSITATDVVEKIDGLTEISQNNAASTEETAATMDQLAEIVEDCRQATTQLNEIAGSLNANAKKFQLG